MRNENPSPYPLPSGERIKVRGIYRKTKRNNNRKRGNHV
jgi:hypothetical protein